MNPGKHVVDRLGGRVAAMRLTGYSKSRVRALERSATIQPDVARYILGRALRENAPLNALDFVPHLLNVQPVDLDVPPPASA